MSELKYKLKHNVQSPMFDILDTIWSMNYCSPTRSLRGPAAGSITQFGLHVIREAVLGANIEAQRQQ